MDNLAGDLAEADTLSSINVKVSSVSMQPDLLLPLLTIQERSSIVVDVGEKQCRIIAVAHGRVVMHSHQG